MKGTVLVVDDERNIRSMILRLLEAMELDAASAGSGEEALALAEEKAPDLVLLDLRLPGMDGMEVLRRLRRPERPPQVAILTAHGTVDNAVEAMKLGAVDFLRKPFGVEELRRVVAEALERRAGPGQVGDAEARVSTAEAPLGEVPEEASAGGFRRCIQSAKAAIERGAIEEAMAWAERAIAEGPLEAEGFTLLGMIMEILGDTGKAQNCYRAAVALDPTYEAAWKRLDRSVGRSRSGV